MPQTKYRNLISMNVCYKKYKSAGFMMVSALHLVVIVMLIGPLIWGSWMIVAYRIQQLNRQLCAQEQELLCILQISLQATTNYRVVNARHLYLDNNELIAVLPLGWRLIENGRFSQGACVNNSISTVYLVDDAGKTIVEFCDLIKDIQCYLCL